MIIVLRIVALMLLLFTTIGTAQQAEKIYGKNRVLKPNEYYLRQIELWSAVIQQRPTDAGAWLNFYRANRNAYIVGEEENVRDAKGNRRFARLNAIVQEMSVKVPGSYEYHFVKWLNGNNDPSLFHFLEKAHDIAPHEAEPLAQMFLYYELHGDIERRDQAMRDFHALGEYSPGLLNYGYNLLSGLEANAIVFTEGDKDTEAIWLLQQGRGVRPDVTMLNLNLILNTGYRERMLAAVSAPPYLHDVLADNESFAEYQRSIVAHVAGNAKLRPVYVAVSVSDSYTKHISERLYSTGLAYQYSPLPMDPLRLLIRNIEQRYALDYLRVYFAHDISVGNVREFNLNYIPAFARLYEHYRSTGDSGKAESWRTLSETIARDAGRMDVYEAHFADK